MREFIFAYNYTGYISTGVKMIAEGIIFLKGLNIYHQDLEYPKLEKIIKEKFEDDLELSGIKYLQIQHSKKWDQFTTNHLVFSIKLKWNTYTDDMIKELQDDLERILNEIKECNKIYYFTSNIFVDFTLKAYLDGYISSKVLFEDLKVRLVKAVMSTGFTITLTSFINNNYSEIIKNAIKSYLDLKFPDLMGTRALNIQEIKLHHLSEGTFDNIEDYILRQLLPFLTRKISHFNTNIIYFLEDFNNILFEMKNSFDKYEYSILLDLENYFYEVRTYLDSKYGLFPNLEYADIFSEENPDTYFYSKDLLNTHKLYYRTFQLNRNNLRTELNRIMDYIRLLMNQKRGRIKKYSKSRLKEILEIINTENEFQDLLYDILHDLGFTDIKLNCGHRGHSEFGKDIVFSSRNMFNYQEWDAIVVKIGKIDQPSGREIRKYIKDIINKGSEALDIPYEDEKGREFKITRVFIATNNIITDPAKRSISTGIEGNVFFIEKDTLLNLC